MCLYSFLWLMGMVLVGTALKIRSSYPQDFGARIASLGGAGAVLSGFTFLPWVALSPLSPVGAGAGLPIEDYGNLLALLLDLLGEHGLARWVSLLTGFGIPGWGVGLALLASHPLGAFGVLLMPVLATLSLLWASFSLFVRSKAWHARVSKILGVLALVWAALVLYCIPVIDTLGFRVGTLPNLVATLCGLHLEFGAWVSWIGLVTLGLGELVVAHPLHGDAQDEDADGLWSLEA